MTPDEVKRLPAEDCLILIGGQKPIRAKKNMRLEQCLNYDLYKKIGNYDLDYKKATSVTYIEGREKSTEIQKQQDLERQAEYARRKEFKAINSKYAKDNGLIESKTDTAPATISFNGLDTPEEAKRNFTEPLKAFNWRDEFGEAVDDEAAEDFMQTFTAEEEIILPDDTPPNPDIFDEDSETFESF